MLRAFVPIERIPDRLWRLIRDHFKPLHEGLRPCAIGAPPPCKLPRRRQNPPRGINHAYNSTPIPPTAMLTTGSSLKIPATWTVPATPRLISWIWLLTGSPSSARTSRARNRRRLSVSRESRGSPYSDGAMNLLQITRTTPLSMASTHFRPDANRADGITIY